MFSQVSFGNFNAGGPLRIAFITPEYVTRSSSDGGLANYTWNVARELLLRGHEVTVFWLSDKDAQWADDGIQINEIKRVQPLSLPGWLRYRLERILPALIQVRSVRRLTRAVLQAHHSAPFDIIHASSFGAAGFGLRRNGQFPLVTRISSYTPMLRSAYGRSRGFAEYLMDWFEIRQILDSNGCFAPSEFLASFFERMEAIRPAVIRSPLITRPNTFGDALPPPELRGLTYFLFFGTLSRIKGVDLFADSIPEVLKQFSETHFVFVGTDNGMPGWPKVMDYIWQKCNAHRDRIHYFESLNKESLFPIIRNSLAVVLPSRVDNYPNACLEAHVAGIPVIGTYNSSLEEMIQPGETGFLVPNGKADELTNAMITVLRLPKERYGLMKRKIGEHVASIQSEDRIQQLLFFYEKVIQQFRGSKGPK